METTKSFENYPAWIVLLSNLVSLAIYGIGFYVMYGLGMGVALLYLLYILVLQYRLLKYHCTKCYYWGKTCGFGQGRLSGLLFKKGDASGFCSVPMGWRDMIPDLLVSLVPMLTGIVLLVIDFSIGLLAALVVLALLTTMGNGYVRGKLTCNHCKQKELGCPAEALFNKD